VLYTYIYNGRDGDSWAANNAPGYIVYRMPLTDQRIELVRRLRAAYGSDD
jgi:transcription antitermination factor NusG